MKTTSSKYAQCLYFTSAALARKVEKMAVDCWKEVNLSPSHAYLLMAVLDEPGIQPGLLSDYLQLQPSTITRFIEKLEDKKLVVRTTEGKATNVYPTPKARLLLPKMKECSQQFSERCGDILGKEENTKLVQGLGRIADKLWQQKI